MRFKSFMRFDIAPNYERYLSGLRSSESADRVKRMAEILGEDVDEWTALAGRLSEDLPEIIHEEPKGVPDLLRAVRGMTADQLRKLCDEAERMKKEGKDEEPGGAKNFCRLHCPLRAVLSSVAIQIRPDTANKAKPPAVTIARRGGVRREN